MAVSLGTFFNTKEDTVDKLFSNRRLATRKRSVTPQYDRLQRQIKKLLIFFFFFFDFIYLLDTERERERETARAGTQAGEGEGETGFPPSRELAQSHPGIVT